MAAVKSWYRVVNNLFLRLLTLSLLGVVVALAAPSARAAAIQDDDYARIVVPDMAQAVAFFRDVLNCQLVSASLASVDAYARGRESLLLSCGAGSVIELSASPSPASATQSHRREPPQLVSDDVAGAAKWLRREGVRVLGAPRTLASGQTVVSFVAPWGVQLQLVSWQAHATAAGD